MIHWLQSAYWVAPWQIFPQGFSIGVVKRIMKNRSSSLRRKTVKALVMQSFVSRSMIWSPMDEWKRWQIEMAKAKAIYNNTQTGFVPPNTSHSLCANQKTAKGCSHMTNCNSDCSYLTKHSFLVLREGGKKFDWQQAPVILLHRFLTEIYLTYIKPMTLSRDQIIPLSICNHLNYITKWAPWPYFNTWMKSEL